MEEKSIGVKQSTLQLSDVVVEAREIDNFINATQLCKAGGKKFNDWYRLESTKELIKELEKSLITGIPVIKNIQLIDISAGRYGGTWIHPDLAIQLAQWISSAFAIQVSRWIRELFIVGTVSIDSRKSDEELKELQFKLEEKDKLLLESKELIEKQKKQIENIHGTNFWVNVCAKNQITTEKFGDKQEGVYIGKYEMPADALKYDRKIGKTTDIKSRRSSYNTGNNPNNEWQMSHKYEVLLGLEDAAEGAIHKLLRGLKISKSKDKKSPGSGSKEIFMAPEKWLDIFISNVCAQFNEWGEQVNSLIDFIEEKERNFDEIDKHVDSLISVLEEQTEQYTQPINKFHIPVEDIYKKFNIPYTPDIKQCLIKRYLRNPEFYFEEAKDQDDDGHWIYMKTGRGKTLYFSESGYLMLCTVLKCADANKVVADAINKVKRDPWYYISLEDAYEKLNLRLGPSTKENLLARYLRNPDLHFKEAESELDNASHFIIRKSGKRRDIYFSNPGFIMLCGAMKSTSGKSILSDALDNVQVLETFS